MILKPDDFELALFSIYQTLFNLVFISSSETENMWNDKMKNFDYLESVWFVSTEALEATKSNFCDRYCFDYNTYGKQFL